MNSEVAKTQEVALPEPIERRNVKHGHAITGNVSATYKSWHNMKQRCINSNHPRFKDYGGRNITICNHWSNFLYFLEDMGEKPSPNHTIERIDNNKGYSKENCIWIDKSEQSKNRRLPSKFKSNKSGVVGVSFSSGYWRAYAGNTDERINLYSGNDFFEACCARKSWEIHKESI